MTYRELADQFIDDEATRSEFEGLVRYKGKDLDDAGYGNPLEMLGRLWPPRKLDAGWFDVLYAKVSDAVMIPVDDFIRLHFTPPVADRIIKNAPHRKKRMTLINRYFSKAVVLDLFIWRRSPEGREYWEEIAGHVR